MRLLSVLLLMALLINACTNSEKEEEQPLITDNQTETVRSMPDEAVEEEEEAEEEIIESEEVIEEKVEIKETVKVETQSKVIERNEEVMAPKAIVSGNIIAVGTVKLNTMLVSEAEMTALIEKQEQEDISTGKMLALLAERLENLEEDDDGIQGFVDASTANMIDTMKAASFEDSLALGTGRMARTTSGKQVKVGAFNEVIAESRSIDIDEQVMATGNGAASYTQLEYMRRPKLLKDFTGYKIELITVYNKSLPLTDDLFKVFGGLSFKEKSENSTTYYLGKFPTKKALEDYLAKVVQPRFPKAKGVKLEKGVEVDYE
jgi:hypothetical protein